MKKHIFVLLTFAFACLMFTNAKAQTTTRSVSDYTGIECNGPFNVTIKIDGTESLTLDIDAAVEKEVITKVENGILKIEFKNWWKNHRDIKRANVYVSAKSLSYLGSSGSGNAVLAAGSITGQRAKIAVSGSGNLKAAVNAETLQISVSGSGNAVLAGSATAAEIRVSGSGEVNGKQLRVQRVEASISGSGNVDIIADEAVSARISGSGGLSYSGNAQIVNDKHSGSGRISKHD
ncbi:head GIN domain-containing protein [Mucilaginibacter psychrotolerans]|uniref:DUF2807 domain-containing protein n=1 Tax=Mucilaginibacter psychrotolerans TaxID=1524096 RepID=A0A4Y8S477_9SPHI|nr:head GIN domain-containing protein [Mucilaginibacter psychrotolerans]TFF33435.1 DUF2807 domain-containing protein [Mucilaginibacter psychrotolerans]